jgi:lipopolysaccharide export system protein LptC
MDIKFLYVAAVAIAAVSGGYYYYSGKEQKLDASSSQNMTYSADQIHLTQTNEDGQLYLRATVDHLSQDMHSKTASLDQLDASMYENGQVNAQFTAKKAQSYNDNEKVVLSEQVSASKILAQGKMQLDTTELILYPKTREIETDQQVVVQSPQANFHSQGLKANLNEGQYEFFNIRGTYEP